MATPTGRGTQPSTPASQPACSRRGSQGGQEGMCRPHLPRVGARVASALQCPSQFSGSLQHPVLGPPAVLGAPCHPARPSASLHASVNTCAMTVGLRVFLLSPRGLAGPVCGPVVSAAPPRCLAPGRRSCIFPGQKDEGGGCPVPVAGSPRPQRRCSGVLGPGAHVLSGSSLPLSPRAGRVAGPPWVPSKA